ncbi:hypothetical protein IGI04_015179 [Brassica rapa subsp. trilocularis]|uniref:Uncharacterized protein n=1 Tax=Brassica rapa subsp. trilocularis TaxID=1813537 RepID=A0ABQ7MPE7_BRACM|nr:hypothetical protein IGI04_015179 [Brassica rapa subsp. trilocularis]
MSFVSLYSFRPNSVQTVGAHRVTEQRSVNYSGRFNLRRRTRADPCSIISTIMARLLQNEEAQKETNEQLAALAAILAPPDGHTSNPMTIRKWIFNTDRTPLNRELTIENTDQTVGGAVQNPNNLDLATIREIAELKLSLQNIHSKIHHITKSVPLVDLVLAATLKTPFSWRIREVGR